MIVSARIFLRNTVVVRASEGLMTERQQGKARLRWIRTWIDPVLAETDGGEY